ncbi:transferrin 2 [Chironomus tepperi]|uniref:transferrin 2 n=1 Tax=Chironomus tepperi TaxID=113505 RepID=UPI00391FA5BA
MDLKCLRSLIYFVLFGISLSQHSFDEHKSDSLIWCTISDEEQYKCQNFTVALERDKAMFDDDLMDLKCVKGYDTDECIKKIDHEKAHIMSLDAGEVFVAGRYFSLIPIMQETLEGGLSNYYAVAVVKKGTLPDVNHIRNLRNKKACFAYVGSQAGWNIPIYTLMNEGHMEVVDCNNHVKNAINFFGKSCAVNSLIDKYNPIGDNSDKLCQLCVGKVPGGWCNSADPYIGFEGAFTCLMEAGDVAFLKHTTVTEMLATKFKHVQEDQLELLCKNGERMPVSEYLKCNWGMVPSNALVTSSARSLEDRKRYQRFLQSAVKHYSRKRSFDQSTTTNRYNRYDNRNRFNDDPFGFSTTSSSPINDSVLYESFQLFESSRYGRRLNLMFQDSTHGLDSLEEQKQTFKTYLGEHERIIYDIRQCPVGRMTMCVTSDVEYEKCVKMRTALKAQLVKPEMLCHKAHSHISCMQSIQNGIADVAVLDAADVYTAGLKYDLIPFMSEVYNLGEPEYYVVAVAKVEDPTTELTYLKNKYTCHSGINTAAGWIYPMAYLISNGWIRPYGCDSMRAAAEYFTKSCIPGAISNEYNIGVPYDNMCDLCHGASYRYCRRDASEDYYGHTGAFRCLVEGGGHVAFVKHTTVFENTGGKRKEWWARDALDDDFELLCPDGTRNKITDYKHCNLGKVKSNAIVTRGGDGYNQKQIDAYINLFVYAQQYYGRKTPDDFSFSMFYSVPPYHDLIFQDSTRQLTVIPTNQRRWDLYLGSDFLRARRITDCDSGANNLRTHSILTLSLIFLAFRTFC